MKSNNGDYRLAGWAALGSALLFLPALGLLVYYDVQSHLQRATETSQALLYMVVLLDAFSKVLGVYAFLRFRTLLNRYYDFHQVDSLIILLIIGGLGLGVLSYLGRLLPEYGIALIVTMICVAIPFAILGIVYAVRLLRLNGNLNGYLKPLAYTSMAAYLCFAAIILAPLGLILMLASSILLGLVLLSGEEELEEVDFV